MNTICMCIWCKNFNPKLLLITMSLALGISSCAQPQSRLRLVQQGQSAYAIAITSHASRYEKQAAELIQQYTRQVTGVTLPVLTADDTTQIHQPVIAIGHTAWIPKLWQKDIEQLPEGSVFIRVQAPHIILTGGGKRGVLNAAYSWIEQVLQCRLYADSVLRIPEQHTVTVSSSLQIIEKPAFSFRQVYDPQAMNARYMDWHRLNDFADFWGLWGHSFFKLIPPEKYFHHHPEYFAQVNGRRQPTQLCLSNPQVQQLVISALQERIRQNPDVLYWSVAPEDNDAFCTCDSCEKLYTAYGGISGALLHFVNAIASHFPDHIITTLAYGATLTPPQHIRAADNVGVMVSTITCNRSAPIATDPRSAKFRQAFETWAHLTNHLMIWDYTIQYTHYLAPFPDFFSFQPNLRYFAQYHAEAIFEQGSGEDPSVFDEWRCYLLAKLLWNPDADVKAIQQDFLQGYYGAAAPYIGQYIQSLEQGLQQSRQRLDIYGNPLDADKSWLSPDSVEAYHHILHQAMQAVQDDPQLSERVSKLYLSVLYTQLLQARFYGTDAHGAFISTPEGQWIPDPRIRQDLQQFQQIATRLGIRYLNEDHQSLEAFVQDYLHMLQQGVRTSLSFHKPVRLLTAPISDYPARGPQTLTDGMLGTTDYAWNWLGWYGQNMEVEIDLQQNQTIHQVNTGFLDDPRHQIFLPTRMEVLVSADGKDFHQVAAQDMADRQFPNQAERKEIAITFAPVQARYVRIVAICRQHIPDAYARPGKLPAVFADEIEVR